MVLYVYFRVGFFDFRRCFGVELGFSFGLVSLVEVAVFFGVDFFIEVVVGVRRIVGMRRKVGCFLVVGGRAGFWGSLGLVRFDWIVVCCCCWV